MSVPRDINISGHTHFDETCDKNEPKETFSIVQTGHKIITK